MAHLYAYCRNDIHYFYRYYAYVILYAFVPVFIVGANFYYSECDGVTREDGQPYGFFMSGMLNLLPVVFTHYIILFVLINNFDAMFMLMFPIAFCWWLWVAAFDDSIPESPYYHSIWPQLFQTPIFWLHIFAGVSAAVVPIYAWLKYRQFFGGNPMHDLTYRGRIFPVQQTTTAVTKKGTNAG